MKKDKMKILIIIVMLYVAFRFFKSKGSTEREANVIGTGKITGTTTQQTGGNNQGGGVVVGETWENTNPPQTQCVNNRVQIRQISNRGNYRFIDTSTPCGESQGGEEITTPVTEDHTVSLAVAAEVNPDTYDLSPMFKNYDTSKFVANFGFMSPLFRGDTVKVEALKAGWSHCYNPVSYPAPVMPDSACSKFITFSGSFGVELRNIASRLAGSHPVGANAFLNDDWPTAFNQDAFISALGEQFSSYALMVDDPSTPDAMRWGGYCLFDQEEVFGIPNGTLKAYFFIKLANAIQAFRPSSVVTWYGFSSTNFWHNYDAAYRGITPESATEHRNEPLFGTTFIRNGKIHFDGQSGYTKASLPLGTIYKKSGDNYILENGKRVLRDDQFSERYLGVKNTWYPTAHPWVAPGLKDNNGVDISDIRFAIASCYRFHLQWKIVMYQCAVTNGYPSDATRWRNYPNKPIAVNSLLTEPATYAGNSPWRRWIAEEQIKFNTMFPIMMGFGGCESWETGRGAEYLYNPDYPGSSGHAVLPYKGTPSTIHWGYEEGWSEEIKTVSDNLSRFKFATKAIAAMRDVYEYYTQNETLRFVDFTHYGNAVGLKEIIMVGMYQNNNMHIACYYPYNDPQDVTKVEFDLNGTKKAINVKGRDVKLLHFTGNFSELEPVAFKAKYKNIDGDWRKVTGDPDQHNY